MLKKLHKNLVIHNGKQLDWQFKYSAEKIKFEY